MASGGTELATVDRDAILAVIEMERRRISAITRIIWIRRFAHALARLAAILASAFGGFVTTTNLPYAGFLGPAALAIATALQSWNPTSDLSLKAKARDTLAGHLDRTALRVVLGEPIDRDEFSRCLQEILREHEGHL